MPLILLYFTILTNLYCAKPLNIVLNFVIDVHFVMVVLLVFSKMWQFPYPFGFCNPVWIYRRKINDDDDDDESLYVFITDCLIPDLKEISEPMCVEQTGEDGRLQ